MRNLILTSIAVLALAGGAVAQTTPATTPAKSKPAAVAKPAMTTPAKPVATASTPAVGRKPMTPESKACSAQADAKGLHGKDREKFRRACLKG